MVISSTVPTLPVATHPCVLSLGVQINPGAADSGVPPLEYLESQASDVRLAVVKIRMLRVHTS